MPFYDQRKAHILEQLDIKIKDLSNRARFIKMVVEGDLELRNVPRADVNAILQQNDFDLKDDSYDYLVRMTIDYLTKEKYEELLNDSEAAKRRRKRVAAQTPTSMWVDDLDDLDSALQSVQSAATEEEEVGSRRRRVGAGASGRTGKRPKK